MKNLLILTYVLIILNSCEQDQSRTRADKPNQAGKMDSITDPNLFLVPHQAKVMVLGVFHFSNPGLDSYKQKFPFDILQPDRQKELDVLLGKLESYQPTKILLEWNRIKSDSIVNKQFQDYLNGSFKIVDKHDEGYQIGFKLAKKLGHDKVYCSDASAHWFGADLDWDHYDSEGYLKSKGQDEKYFRYGFESFYQLGDSLKAVRSLIEHLTWLNHPKNRLKDHQAYLTSIIEGAGDHYIGADGVARWYRRNLRIFANAYDVASFDKEERLLLIYGAGHVWQLRQFFKDAPDFDYVESNQYLVE
ncbi:MAG: DUF5694 domain-containing protein [Bacteroidota bacterium]